MTATHLTDAAIQEYAMGLAPQHAAHINGCPACRAKAQMYREMVACIQAQPAPVFDFDVSAAVLAHLPAPRRTALPRLLYVALTAILLVSGAALYIFRADVVAVFSGAASMMTWVMVTSLLTILIFQGLDLLKTYRKKMREMLQHSSPATV